MIEAHTYGDSVFDRSTLLYDDQCQLLFEVLLLAQGCTAMPPKLHTLPCGQCGDIQDRSCFSSVQLKSSSHVCQGCAESNTVAAQRQGRSQHLAAEAKSELEVENKNLDKYQSRCSIGRLPNLRRERHISLPPEGCRPNDDFRSCNISSYFQ